jgi:hypothetical protein
VSLWCGVHLVFQIRARALVAVQPLAARERRSAKLLQSNKFAWVLQVVQYSVRKMPSLRNGPLPCWVPKRKASMPDKSAAERCTIGVPGRRLWNGAQRVNVSQSRSLPRMDDLVKRLIEEVGDIWNRSRSSRSLLAFWAIHSYRKKHAPQ